MIVRCPTSPNARQIAAGEADPVTGCGALFPAELDEEGFADCPHCGIWFKPSEEPATIVSEA